MEPAYVRAAWRRPSVVLRSRAVRASPVLALLALTAFACTPRRQASDGSTPNVGEEAAYVWQLPPGFVPPKVPADNPMSEAKVKLGRQLFYDPRLSQNGTQSCASCHKPELAFTDGLPQSIGSTGERNRRGAMSLINVAYLTSYTWANPVLRTLEAQAMVPIFGTTPVELGDSDVTRLMARFTEHAGYKALFARAFPKDKAPVSLGNLVRAIACFERTLISASSPYDRYFFGGDENALTASAKRGNELFFSERLECNHCHAGFHLMDSTQTARTKEAAVIFHNTGLYNIDGKGSYPARDTGIADVTTQPDDVGRFRAQTLRNIKLTAPYFHDGSAKDLDAVIDHYAAGGRTIAQGPDAGDGSKNPGKSPFLIGFTLTAEERSDLHAFFDALTDPTIAKNPAFQPPPVLP